MGNDIPPAARGEHGKWLPGRSANPGGRPAGSGELVKTIQRRLDTNEWFDIVMAIMRGQGVRVIDGRAFSPNDTSAPAVPVTMPKPKDQITAAKLLMEAGGFKPVARHQIDNGRALGVVDVRELSDDDLAEITGVLERSRLTVGGED